MKVVQLDLDHSYEAQDVLFPGEFEITIDINLNSVASISNKNSKVAIWSKGNDYYNIQKADSCVPG